MKIIQLPVIQLHYQADANLVALVNWLQEEKPMVKFYRVARGTAAAIDLLQKLLYQV